NTASMVEEQPRLVDAVPTFVQEALARRVDLHLAVTTTGIETASAACPGGAQGGEAGRFVPVDGSRPRLMTHTTPNLATALQENVKVGQCAFVEKGLEAVRRALSTPLVDSDDDPRSAQANDGNKGFLRDEAALAVVFIGDEDDHSPDDVETYVRFLQSKKGSGQPGRATVYAIAPTNAICDTAGGTGTRYDQAAARTGGAVLNICDTDYRPLMTALAGKAFGPQDRFPLSAQPEVATLNVLVNGVPVNGTWTYDSRTNSIVFSTRPPSGARIQVDYRRVCPI
ncbi:MAG: choice-of-anchor D domain-containing protein, partial [Myxococcaceae bacterium]